MRSTTVVDTSGLLRHAEGCREEFLRDLARLVSIDTGSGHVAGIETVAGWATNRLLALGFTVEAEQVHDGEGRALGPVLVARRPAAGRATVLLLAHMDTVYPVGTASARPLRVDGTRATGPGVCDDKGGLLAGLHAVAALDAVGLGHAADLVVVLTPDEEIGAPGSGPVLERLAAECDVALCLECARENGDIVAARKGVADLHLSVCGRSAHPGVDPDRGASAAHEVANLVLDLAALDGTRPGLTTNVGVVAVGSRPNVVPASGTLVAEVRATTLEDLHEVIDRVRARAARPVVEGVTIDLDVRGFTPPMERTAATERLVEQATQVAARLGVTVEGSSTGGVSDGNLVAAQGCPTLDGLGPVGGDDHSDSEWLDLDSVPSRIALLAGLIASLGSHEPCTPDPELRETLHNPPPLEV